MKRIIALSVLGSSYLAAAGQPVAPVVPNSTVPESTTPGNEEVGGFGGFPFFMLILMLVFMYFVLIRPQNKEQKRRKSMMEEIKVGVDVVTIGGIHGVVARRGEQDIDVTVAKDVVMTFNLGAVNQVVKDGEQVDGRK